MSEGISPLNESIHLKNIHETSCLQFLGPLDSVLSLVPRSHLNQLTRHSRPRIDDIAEEILNLLTSSAYRKGSLDRMRFAENRGGMLAALRQRIGREGPVQLTLMAFPFKVPNPAKVGSRALPDLAELAAILRFRFLKAEIEAVYPPGLELHILHDGALIAEVFEVEVQEVRRYEAYFQYLIQAAGAGNFIHCHDFEEMQQYSGFKVSSAIEDLRAEALSWWSMARDTTEWWDCFRKTLGMMNLRGFPIQLPMDLLREAEKRRVPAAYKELEQRVHKAMVEYRIKDEIIHRFDPRPICFPDAIHTTTRERPGRLALWLVRRGRGLLPWHGVGLVDSRGRACVTLAMFAMNQPHVKPVYIANEDTPFFYSENNREINITSIVRR